MSFEIVKPNPAPGRLRVALFDFDGTITKQDVGNAFFRTFGGEVCSRYIEEYKGEKISAKELFRREVEALGMLDERKAREFLHQQN